MIQKIMFKRLCKYAELVHLPSAMMICMLIFIPTFLNTHSFAYSILRSFPLTLAGLAGFALNNCIDIEKDRINKPDRALPSGILSVQTAIISSVFFYFLSLILTIFLPLSYPEMAIDLVGIAGTIIYSVLLNKIGYIKTIITGLLTILPFIVVLISYPSDVSNLTFCFAILLATIGKELLMDVRDISGDRISKQKTIAIRFGTRSTEIISMVAIVLSIICFLLSSLNTPELVIILPTSAFFAFIGYLLWFKGGKLQRDVGIYLLWGVIISWAIPVIM